MPVLEIIDFKATEDVLSIGALAPWEQSLHGLTSWFEMLNFSAQAFFWCGRALRQLMNECLLGSIPGEDTPIFQFSLPLSDRATKKAVESFTAVEKEFRNIGMNITADTILEVLAALESTALRRNFQWLHDQVTAVERLTEKELRNKIFFYVSPEKARFFPTQGQPYPLTEKVFKAFPSAIYDTNEAAWSLALDRSTAAVFHLMRILEIGLGCLGKVFGVSLAHTNWAPALDQIESKIREMHKDPVWKALPDCKEQQEFYAQAASNFGILKDAWRNYTMHVRAKYTEDEAEQIFVTVKALMSKLAERLSE